VSDPELMRQKLAVACASNDVPEDLLLDLLDLEKKHQNLHAWGARPALRRDIAAVIDAHLKDGASGT
jgi:hypothetical protein